MKKQYMDAVRVSRIITSCLFLVAAMAIGMKMSGDIGVLRSGSLENRARQAAGIDSGTQCVSAEKGKLKAMLFYDGGSSDEKASRLVVYRNRTGMDGMHVRLGWFPEILEIPGDDGVIVREIVLGKTEWKIYASAGGKVSYTGASAASGERYSLKAGEPFVIISDCELEFVSE